MGGACARFTCPRIVPCWAPPMWPVPITFGPGPQTGAVRVGQDQGTRRTLRGSSRGRRGQQGDRGSGRGLMGYRSRVPAESLKTDMRTYVPGEPRRPPVGDQLPTL